MSTKQIFYWTAVAGLAAAILNVYIKFKQAEKLK